MNGSDKARERLDDAERERRAAAIEASVRGAESLDVVVFEVGAVALVKGEYVGQKVLRVTLVPEFAQCPTQPQEWAGRQQAPVDLVVRADTDLATPARRFVVGQRIAAAFAVIPPREPWPNTYVMASEVVVSGPTPAASATPPDDPLETYTISGDVCLYMRRIVARRGEVTPHAAYAMLLSAQGRLADALSGGAPRNVVRNNGLEVAAMAVVICESLVGTRIKIEDIAQSLNASRAKWPRSRCLLEALGEEVGEVGRGAQAMALGLPEDHKKYTSPSDFRRECLDVAAVAMRIVLDGVEEFAR